MNKLRLILLIKCGSWPLAAIAPIEKIISENIFFIKKFLTDSFDLDKTNKAALKPDC